MTDRKKTKITNVLTESLKGLPFYGIMPVGGVLGPDAISLIMKAVGIHDYINESVVTSVLYEVFSSSLRDRISGEVVETGALSPADINKIVALIVNTLASLPNMYEVILPLPTSEKPLPRERLTDDIEILTLIGDDWEPYAAHAGKAVTAGSLGSMLSSSMALEGQNVLRIQVKGYISRFGVLETKGVDPFFYYKAIFAYLKAGSVFRKQAVQYTSYGQYGYIPRKYEYFVLDSNKELARPMIETFDDDYLKNENKFDDRKSAIEEYQLKISQLKKLLKNANKLPQKIGVVQVNILQSLYWYYECAKANENHNIAVTLCSCIDSLFQAANDKERDGRYSTAIKCEMIAQATTSDIENEQWTKSELINIFNYRNRVVHGKEQINSIDKYRRQSIDVMLQIVPEVIIANYIRKRVAKYVIKIS